MKVTMTNSDERPGCLGSVLQLLGLQPQTAPQPEQLPYQLVDAFLSAAELSFYHVLRQVVQEQATICTKVSLGDLFYPKTADRGQNMRYRNKIDRKHVDFLLCDPQTMKPMVGIELDDASHQRADRTARDVFVDEVFATAGLPLVRVPAQASYAPREIMTQLESVGWGSVAAIVESASEGPPLCPACGVPMVIRTAKRGSHKGEQFYACPNYPDCREVMKIA